MLLHWQVRSDGQLEHFPYKVSWHFKLAESRELNGKDALDFPWKNAWLGLNLKVLVYIQI